MQRCLIRANSYYQRLGRQRDITDTYLYFVYIYNMDDPTGRTEQTKGTSWTLGPKKIISWIEPQFQAFTSLSHKGWWTVPSLRTTRAALTLHAAAALPLVILGISGICCFKRLTKILDISNEKARGQAGGETTEDKKLKSYGGISN